MRRRAIVLSLIGIAIIILTIYLADFNKVVNKLSSLSPEYMLSILGIQLLSILVASIKWRIILRHSKVRMQNLLHATFVGYFVNNITPIGLAGGEPIKAYILSKTDNVPITTAASSVIVDLFLEIVPMFLLSTFAIYLVSIRHISPVVIVFLVVIILALITLFLISLNVVLSKKFSLQTIKKIMDILCCIPLLKEHIKHTLPKVEEISKEFNDAIRLHMLDNKTLALGTTLSFIVWGLRFLRTYLIFEAIGSIIDYQTIVAVETMVSVLSFLPLFPGALGIWEGSSTILYTLITQPQVGEAAAAAATLINRFFMFLLPSLIGITSAIYLGLNIKKITSQNT